MRIVVAPQEFKGTLTAAEAADAIAGGVRRVRPAAEIDSIPFADGGPGTVAAVIAAAHGRISFARVEGPLGDPVMARWGRIDDGTTAVIEIAAAAGLVLVPPARRDPLRATTSGLGELIRAALDAHVTRLLIGVGGSATVDGGAGMAAALGARFLDDRDRPLPPGGAALVQLARIDVARLDPRLREVEVVVLADVRNPLLGPEGAAAIYAPQKGADAQGVAVLEQGLTNYAGILDRDVSSAASPQPGGIGALAGGGAGGGIAAGLVAFAGARIEPGAKAVARTLRFANRLAGADAVITGEGQLDGQSAFGKSVAMIAAIAGAAGVPCFAVAGSIVDRPAVLTLPGLVDCEAAILDQDGMASPDAIAAAAERLLRRALPRSPISS